MVLVVEFEFGEVAVAVGLLGEVSVEFLVQVVALLPGGTVEGLADVRDH